MDLSNALVLFDIDGTLIRRAGPHHRQALVDAVRRVTGRETTTDGVPVAGMLDQDIVDEMLRRSGAGSREIRRAMPEVLRVAQVLYARSCPALQRKTCPGVRRALERIHDRGATIGLVTGNLPRIGWKKMERAGIKHYFRLGSFCDRARNRAGLVRAAVRQARQSGWIKRGAAITLIGDHPNDVAAARAAGVRAIAVGTGVVDQRLLAAAEPDILLPDLRALRLEMLL